MSYLGLFELEISKTIAIFEISTLKFVCLKISQKKKNQKKFLSLVAKMLDLGIFWIEFENNFVIFEINTQEFV